MGCYYAAYPVPLEVRNREEDTAMLAENFEAADT